jgi:ketosteroid isomerase-like protein
VVDEALDLREVSIDVEEIVDLGDRALGITRFHGVSSDVPPVVWLWCHLVSFRDGLISQAQSFLDRESAVEAAGLRQYGAHDSPRTSEWA